MTDSPEKSASDQASKATTISEDQLNRLINVAGSQPEVSSERYARVYASVHSVWQEKVREKEEVPIRKRPIAALAIAASLIVVLGAFSLFSFNSTVEHPLLVAKVINVKGQVTQKHGQQREPSQQGGQVFSTQIIETVENSGLALQLVTGQSLRIDQNSKIQLLASDEIDLIRGAVYVDSGSKNPSSSIRIHTPYGRVSDIGTQFEVRLTEQHMSIKVREGIVELNSNQGVEKTLVRTDVLQIGKNHQMKKSKIAPDSTDWMWTQTLAPAFEFEGNNLNAFLNSFSREKGWNIAYSNEEIKEYALTTKLHGSIKGMSDKEILQVVAIVGAVEYELKDHTLVIHRNKDSTIGGQ